VRIDRDAVPKILTQLVNSGTFLGRENRDLVTTSVFDLAR